MLSDKDRLWFFIVQEDNNIKYNNLQSLQNLNNGSIVETLVDRLSGLILSGEITSGFVFPNENDFCCYLGVGRSTLRETYKVLESNGLIKRSRKGTIVNTHDEIVANMPYDMVFGIANYNEILVFRTAIEQESAALAAQFATEDNIVSLEKTLEGMKQNLNDVKKLTVYDTMFHLEIARASNNRLFCRTLGDLLESFSKTVSRNFIADEDIRVRAIQYHSMILQAVKEGNSVAARDYMAKHVTDVVNLSNKI